MRIIKFRIPIFKQGKFEHFNFHEISIEKGQKSYSFGNCNLIKESQEFTGVIDDKGKEIYEGDFISFKQHHFNTDLIIEKIKIVKYNYDRWNIFETNAGETDIEVVGNIYETPEMEVNLN